MSARPDLCGGYRVSGIPTAIDSYTPRRSEEALNPLVPLKEPAHHNIPSFGLPSTMKRLKLSGSAPRILSSSTNDRADDRR